MCDKLLFKNPVAVPYYNITPAENRSLDENLIPDIFFFWKGERI